MSTVSNAVATRDNSPAGLVQQYKGDFAAVLPSHVRADTWVRLATGALRRDAKLREAAEADPWSLMAALLDAARLGHEPGTEAYYLTPRKEKGQLKVLGIEGFQGIIERIYRAGAVSSIVAECVYTADKFTFSPGRDERPIHEIDWDAADRGQLRLAYSYAVMKDGATSKVVVLNQHDITRIKASSQGSDSSYSPWVNHTAAMWLKSALRQLRKYVPTSAEYRQETQRASAAASEVAASTPLVALPPVDSEASVVEPHPFLWDTENNGETCGVDGCGQPQDADVHQASAS